jgi:hypothetical protein
LITAADAEFHQTTSSDPGWTETLYFPFSVPDKSLCGGFYLVARPNVGVIMCDVSVHDRLSHIWDQMLYVDNQQHMPCPESFLDFSLPCGYTVKVVEPLKRYELSYTGYDDTQIDLTFDALMAPYDMNDPAMDPLAAARHGGAWDASFNGHYEVTGRITGNARIRGVDHRVDVVDTGDRSWGIRKERGSSAVAWFHGSFGEGLTFHALAAIDPASHKNFIKLASGYVLDQGEVRGLVDIVGSFTMDGIMTTSVDATVTDARGKSFSFIGEAINASPWAPCPNAVYAQSYMRWNHAGQTGYGVHQQGLDRGYLTKNRDAFARA